MPDYSEVDMKGVIFKYKLIQGEYKNPLFFCIDRLYQQIKNIIDKEIEEQINQDYGISGIHIEIRREYQDDREYQKRRVSAKIRYDKIKIK